MSTRATFSSRYRPGAASGWLLGSLAILVLAWGLPALAADPACAGHAAMASPAEYQSYCTNHPGVPGLSCDLGLAWDPATMTSPDIRVGDAYSTGAEQPRFFYDDVGDLYYTRLYSQVRNLESGPAASSEVTVDYAYTEDVAAALVDPTHPSVTWHAIGTYQAYVPTSPHVILPGLPYHQTPDAVCWDQPSGVLFPTRFVLRATVTWAEDEDLTNNTAYRLYDLTKLGQPAQIALALDLSGSMGSSLSSGFTKLVVAKTRANQFVDLVEAGHQLGVYSFSTSNSENTSFATTYRDAVDAAHTRTLNETSVIEDIKTLTETTDKGAIKLKVSAQSSHGCTPVGQGLLRARQAILDSPFPEAGGTTPSKAIVLLSDGLQNAPPYVNTAASFGCASGTAGPVISAGHTFADDDIKIYSIFFGEAIDMGHTLMTQIKNQTGGDFVYGATDDLGLAITYYSIRGLVDDMIALVEEGEVSAGAPSTPFTIELDSAASDATVTVAWPHDNGLTRLAMERCQVTNVASCQDDGEWVRFEDPPVGAGSNVRGTTATRPLVDPSPYRVYRFAPGPNTTWKLRVRQLAPDQGSTSFAAAVFSDVEALRLAPSLDDESFVAGDPLPIHVEVLSLGHPVHDAQVSAKVRVPTRPFSTTLRRYAGRFDVQDVQDGDRAIGIVQQLKRYLKKDGEPDDLTLSRMVPVELLDDGSGADALAHDGIYSGTLPGSETRVAGRYQVTITATGKLPSGKTATRIARLATLADVGPADPGASRVKITGKDPGSDGGGTVQLAILPTDRYGNAAFPGSGDRIKVLVDGRPVAGPQDALDTTFTQQVTLPAKGSVVAVEVDGVTVLEPVDPFSSGTGPGATRWSGFSLHLGAAVPHGTFGTFFSAGPAAGIDYTLQLDRNLALRAELDLNRFDLKRGGDRMLTNVDLYLRYLRPTSGPWTPYFEGGLGFYDLESFSSGPGFALGIGAEYQINPSWDLDLTVRGHRVGGGLDLGFSQVLGGLIYRF